MQNKQELLEKLTGIQSSRRSYYKELNLVVEEMKQKNKQLEVINQLVQIKINSTWQDVSIAIAAQLAQLFSFERFVLSLPENGSLTCYVVTRDDDEKNGWSCSIHSRPLVRDATISQGDVDSLLAAQLATSVSPCTVLLKSQRNQVLGSLSLLHAKDEPLSEGQRQLFTRIAEHVTVEVENILLYKDLSKKVNLEAQLVQSAKMAALGEMAAGVAHELNSPLTAILGNIQLLLREPVLGDYRQLMQDIYQCGVRCKKIIQNLLIFSRQEEYHFEWVTVSELVEDTLGLMGYQLAVSGVKVIRQLPEEPLYVYASRHQIEQILINLLLNARDALQGKEEATVTISAGVREDEDGISRVYLAVTDNGIGMETEVMEQIFQPFFTTKSTSKGTGLGLSVSLGIAEAHGGKLTVESEPGLYSRFTLLLPNLAGRERAYDVQQTCADRG